MPGGSDGSTAGWASDADGQDPAPERNPAGCGCRLRLGESRDCQRRPVYEWMTEIGTAGQSSSFPVVEIEFKGGRREYFRKDESLELHTGDAVIVEADRGIDLGTVHLSGDMVRLRLRAIGAPDDREWPRVIRLATEDDINQYREGRSRDAETFLVGRRTIERINLPMKLVDVEWQFDGKKVTFYFTAEHRVDFRELVRRLARRFRTRVELRQIGARDEAARIGGIGSCGRTLCCSGWLQDFTPVSTQAAKTQNLPLNPVRLSGQCGRLKCCLNYELQHYTTALRRIPASSD